MIAALMDGFLSGAINADEYKLLDSLGASKLIAVSVAMNDEARQNLIGARGAAMAKTVTTIEERGGGERTITQRSDTLSLPGPEKRPADVASDEDPVIIDVAAAPGPGAGSVSDSPTGPAPPPSPLDRLKFMRGE